MIAVSYLLKMGEEMGKIRRKKPIDFVIIWVDGNDPKWRAVKNQYDGIYEEAYIPKEILGSI